MPERLPRWVWLGATALSAVAGIVNAVGFLGFQQQAITHLTGNTTLLGVALAAGESWPAVVLASMIAAFVLGATASGLIIQDTTLRLGRRYGVALLIECALLVAAAALFARQALLGPVLAAVACGLQNGMVTTYSGAVVRTTHVSGMFTDLGLMLGHRLRGLPVSLPRLKLSLLVIGGFGAGGVLGAWLFAAAGYAALLVPAGVTGIAGAAHLVYRTMAARTPA